MSSPGFGSNTLRLVPACPALRERDERLESLIMLAGRLVHDFNNFLVPVLGYTALLREELQPDSPVMHYVSAMEKSARNTENAIKDILLTARSQRPLKCQKVDFAQLVAHELAQWQKSLPPTSGITVQQLLQPAFISLDETQWPVALQHLFQNVRFALAAGGTLSVSLEPKTLTNIEAAELGLASTEVFRLMIQDDGFGMTDDTLRRAFEPFFSTRPRAQASGMGLAVVHSIVRSHGGQVVLESKQDAGSTVTIWLPVGDAETDLQMRQSSSGEGKRLPAAEPAAKILLVDDDPFTLEVIKAFLQRAKFDVILARNGCAGLKLFKTHAKDMSLIISAMVTPEMNGVEMAKQIRKLHPNIPMVLISGARDEFLEKALTEIASPKPQLIRKPFRLKGLIEAVQMLVG
jgi:CheY-like chemotaxis protein